MRSFIATVLLLSALNWGNQSFSSAPSHQSILILAKTAVSMGQGFVGGLAEPLWLVSNALAKSMTPADQLLSWLQDSDFIRNFEKQSDALKNGFHMGYRLARIFLLMIPAFVMYDRLMQNRENIEFVQYYTMFVLSPLLIYALIDVGLALFNLYSLVGWPQDDNAESLSVIQKANTMLKSMASGGVAMPKDFIAGIATASQVVTTLLEKVCPVMQQHHENRDMDAALYGGYMAALVLFWKVLTHLAEPVTTGLGPASAANPTGYALQHQGAYYLRAYPALMLVVSGAGLIKTLFALSQVPEGAAGAREHDL